MTEEEAKLALFKLHQEYMTHTPKERLKIYDEYKNEREKIRQELINYISNSKLNDSKIR